MRGLSRELFDYAVYWPADMVAALLGGLLYIAYFFGSLALSIVVGKFIYDHLNVPVLRVLLALLVGVWINLVLYVAQVPTAVTFIRAAEMSEID